MDQSRRARAQHYIFAHRVMPQAFFADPSHFIAYLTQDGDAFLRFFWDQIGARVQTPRDRVEGGMPHAQIRKLDHDVAVALITLPEPLFVPEAYFAAAAYHPEIGGKMLARYYTLEYGLSVRDQQPYTVFCGWTGSIHFNMGSGPPPEMDAFAQAVQAKLADADPPGQPET